MQVSEPYRQQLRAIFAARVRESFASARRCLALARMARHEGDRVRTRKWLWCARVLRLAAAGWRERARGVVPILLLLLLIGCARSQGSMTMTLTLTDDEQGDVEWQLAMPEEVWRHMRPAKKGVRTFELDHGASVMLVSWIDDELARKHLCPHAWSFGPGFRLRDGTLVFTGQCDRRLVRG